jgi:hypothetical protein
MEKMRSGAGTSANFDWSNPNAWSGQKSTAAAHVAHKAQTMGAMASPSASAWQTAEPSYPQQPAPQYAPQPQYAQQPQYAPQYAQQQPAYGQAPPQQPQQYWPHLLPGPSTPPLPFHFSLYPLSSAAPPLSFPLLSSSLT